MPLSATERLHVALMLALTFSTGVIDATGYLGLDRVFTGNMTGNVVILGMGLLGADDLPVVGPIIALAGFLAGAVIAGRVLRPVPAGWTARSTAVFGVVAAILAIGTGIAFAVPAHGMPPLVQYPVTGALAIAMGMQAGCARHVGVKDVSTVVVTSTMAGLAFDSHLGARTRQPWARRLLAIVLIGLGALAGAALLHVHLALPLALATAVTVAVALIGHQRRAEAP